MSTAAHLAELERSMLELEAMLHEVESVSAVLDFDLLPSKAEVTPRSSSYGVKMLAAEVAEELHSWREQQETEHALRCREHQRLLQEMVSARKNEEEDHAQVRLAIRREIFDSANATICSSLSLPFSVESRGPPATGESAGGWALLQLQARLNEVVTPVETLQLREPPEMFATAHATATALEVKRARARGAAQRARFLESTAHLDAELVEEAEALGILRQRALAEQTRRQEDILRCLEEAAAERRQAFDELDARVRSGPGSAPADVWPALWPVQDEKDGHRPIAREDVFEDVMQQGEARARALADSFARRCLPGGRSARAADVEAELEAWRLRAGLGLLEELGNLSEGLHVEWLRALRTSLERDEGASSEQLLNLAVSAAEDFRSSRNAHFAKQRGAVEEALSRQLQSSLAEHTKRRRRAEWCALKRLEAVRGGVGATTNAEAVCLKQLGQAVQRLVKDCHSALPMFAGSFGHLGPPAGHHASVWDHSSAPASERLRLVERATSRLPDSAEACAILKGLLCIIDEEMKLICGLLTEACPSEPASDCDSSARSSIHMTG